MNTGPSTQDPTPRALRLWFYAAAVYNALWGLLATLAPGLIFRVLDVQPFQPIEAFQCIGMIVGVYAYGYYLLARDPERYSGFIWIGIAGKTLGPLGFLAAAIRGHLPWRFGFTIITNDLVWWPAFWLFAVKFGRRPIG